MCSMTRLSLLALILWLLALIAGAKLLQYRAETMDPETSEWIMDDHRLYQVCSTGRIERMDVLGTYQGNINDKGE